MDQQQLLPPQPQPVATVAPSSMGGGGVKHFKKSMIFEFEKIESEKTEDDSQSSVSSAGAGDKSQQKLQQQQQHSPPQPLPSSKVAAGDEMTTKSNSESNETGARKRKIDDDDNNADSDTKHPHSSSNDHHHHVKKKKKKSKSAASSSPSPSSSKCHHSSGDKAASKKEKKVYCICKSTDTKRFMIACDNCDEWYHGSCVGVKESLSKKIKAFFCHVCRSHKASLHIKYVSKFRELSRSMTAELTGNSTSISSDKFDASRLEGSYLQFYKETQARLKREGELLKSLSHLEKLENKAKWQSTLSKGCETDTQNKSHAARADIKLEPSEQQQQTNDGLLNLNSLSSKHGYGKTNVTGEDIENFVSAIAKLNETAAHATAATTTEIKMSDTSTTNHDSSNNEDHDYVGKTATTANRSARPSLDDAERRPVKVRRKSWEHNDDETDSDEQSDYSKNTSDSSSSETDNESTNSENLTKSSKASAGENKSAKRVGQAKKSQNKNQKSKKPNTKAGGGGSKANLKAAANKLKKPAVSRADMAANRKKKPTGHGPSRQGSAASLVAESEEKKEAKSEPPVQCYGPECVNAAVPTSKYCSHECGMKLAKTRLINYLRTHFNDLSSQHNKQQQQSDSDQLNLSELEKINNEVDKLKKRLVELEQKHLELDKIIERAKFANINPNVEKDRDKSMDTNEAEIYCVTCGVLCSEKYALKHMEKCYNKVESQAFFGSFYKTHIEGQSIFCDYYNSKTKMYCKRLKTMCPEHEKEKKINETEVCGYPLPSQANILLDSQSEICLAPKRSCSLHFRWEKLRRAQIDLEKLRTWLRLEELQEQKRLNESSLNQRRGLLSNLLYQTVIHEEPASSSSSSIITSTSLSSSSTTSATVATPVAATAVESKK